MFLLVFVRHVGSYPDGYQHGVSIQISINFSLQCRRIFVGRNLARVRNIVVAAIFHFMTVEDWGE